jgi:16S rRNA (uracil1498-N3)-methyltransferase
VFEPRFLVPSLDPGSRRVVLSDAESHHALRVLRLRRGDLVRVFDGVGHEWAGAVHDVGPRRVAIALDRPVETVREPPVDVTLAIGLLKGDQMDTVVRDSTALGAAAILPLVSARVVAPTRARVEAARERWRRVAVQSAKQCRRAVVPIVAEPARLEDVLAGTAGGQANRDDARLMLVEPAADELVPTDPPPAPRTAGDRRPRALLLIGPEGGWTADEVRLAAESGVRPWRLGPRTIKAETIPTVALAALWTSWGWQ